MQRSIETALSEENSVLYACTGLVSLRHLFVCDFYGRLQLHKGLLKYLLFSSDNAIEAVEILFYLARLVSESLKSVIVTSENIRFAGSPTEIGLKEIEITALISLCNVP
jgi:hypothetical protein